MDLTELIHLTFLIIVITIQISHCNGQKENRENRASQQDKNRKATSLPKTTPPGLVPSSVIAQPVKTVDYSSLTLQENLLKGSRWAIERKQSGSIIEVFHAIEILDIVKVDVQSMSVRIELHLRQRWEADDLELPQGLFEKEDDSDVFIRVDSKVLSSIWSPDSFIPAARETQIAHMVNEQSIVNIFQNKTIVYKTRMYTVLGCSFSFQWYPLDKQTCDLTFESYSLPATYVRYRWETVQEPVSIASLKLLQYSINLPLQYGNGSAERWGRREKFPYVLVRFKFERQLNHNIIQVYTPTLLVVAISWFSFWLGLDAIPGRISLLITCMLSLVTMHTGIGNSGALPAVNYIKMMDIWMVTCMAFVFAALCEFVIVKFMHWKKQQKLKGIEKREKELKEYLEKHQFQSKTTKDKPKSESSNPYLEFYKNYPNCGKNAMNDIDSEKPEAFPIAMLAAYQRQGLLSKNPPKPAWLGQNNVNVPNNPLHPQQRVSPSGECLHPVHRTNDSRHPLSVNEQWGYLEGYPGQQQRTQRPTWMKIDRASRILFPFTFLIFNLIYWPYLFIGASNQ